MERELLEHARSTIALSVVAAYLAASSCTQRDGAHEVSTDAGTEADSATDASERPLPRICELTAETAAPFKDSACRIQLGKPPESSLIYQRMAEQPGIAPDAEACKDHPLAWYREAATASSTTLVACAQACERSTQLFLTFVATTKPLAGCQDHQLIGGLCQLPEFSFLGISESSCALPITRPEDRTLAYEAVEMRGAQVVTSYADCAAHPLAVFPNHRSRPSQLVACDAACAMSSALFPAFVVAAWPLLGCEGVVGDH
ncbi:MAG TPA: hypothetical protein VJV78_11935 [Polyangiales bacterium]|nr:hypothetical protein [Polyangiales bacterium]